MISANFQEVGSNKAGDVFIEGLEIGSEDSAEITDMIFPEENLDLTPCSPSSDDHHHIDWVKALCCTHPYKFPYLGKPMSSLTVQGLVAGSLGEGAHQHTHHMVW